MLQLPEYRERWERKKEWYKEQGILSFENGGGPEGTLIITKDDKKGGIQSDEIEKLLDRLLML